MVIDLVMQIKDEIKHIITKNAELQAQVDELQVIIYEQWNKYIAEHLRADTLAADLLRANNERDNLKANNQQLHTLAGEQAATIDELQKQVDELTNAGRKMSTELANMQDYITKVRAGRERYRSMCSEMATNIQDALSIADEGLA